VPEERRLVTIVFADVVGSTALGELLDAEDMRSMLGAYYAIAKEVVAAYGGTLEKFIGDAVMGVFGLPHAYGDDAERALGASLELRDRVRVEPTLADLKLRFGVCTGEVVATREPGADFLITGDAVNVAARLQQAAEPWAILASARTLAAVSASFEVGPPMEITAKGKGSAISAVEVRSKLGTAATVRRPKARMRGRQDELDQLALTGRRAFRDKRPAFVTIIAPAGTGKSRLLDEFLNQELPVIAPGAVVAVAQCLPYGNQLTYWPLRQVVFRLAGTAEDASAAEVRERLIAWLDDPRYADLLATSIGYGTGEAPDRTDVFAAWRFALEKASRVQPLVLVFEDLHWSSESLLDLVDFVMQTHGDAPILMLALSRPELLDRRASWGGGRRNFTNLVLEPLREDDMRSLVRDLFEGGTEKMVDAVVARAGGNPFYAEELVRSLMERGDVEALPDTVQASIQARLDLLPADERRLLQVGSIFGRTFRISGIAAIEPELQEKLAGLVEGLLVRAVVKQDDSDHLSFSHILIREVTYQSMTRAERARLHAAAGAWLESRGAGREASVAEIIAFHYREAALLLGRQRIADVDLAVVKNRAVHWLSLAGDVTGAAGANVEASRHFRAAIELGSEDQLPELYERLGDVEQLRLGSVDAYQKALELGRQSKRPAVDELRVLGSLLMGATRWADSIDRFSRAQVDAMLADGRALARSVDSPRSLAKFFVVGGFYPWHVSRLGGEVTPEMLTEAEASARKAATLAEGISDWNTWSAALDGVTSCMIERHEWTAAREVAQQRIDKQDELSIVERVDAYHMAFHMSYQMGDLVRGEAITQQSSSLLDYAQTPSLVLALLGNRMLALLMRGRWDEVQDLGDHVFRVWNESHEALGPARIAFPAGLEVSRARRDAARAGQFRDALSVVANTFPSAHLLKAYAELNLPVMEREMLTSRHFGFGRIDIVERTLSALVDSGYTIADSTVATLNDFAVRMNLPLLRAGVLRAGKHFAEAAQIWADSGAKPYEARARIELAESQGVRPDPEMVEVLRKLGDIEYLEAHQLG
jgi:class 3 adenylate cyclase